MTEQEKADFDRRVRLALEREPDWKTMSKDPFIQWVGLKEFQIRYSANRFNALQSLEPVGWACLVDRIVREAFVLQALDDIMREDRETIVRGLHALRVVQLAFLPWTLANLPTNLAWALFSRRLNEADQIARLQISGVERLTDRQLTIWKYFLLRQSHWVRHDAMFAACQTANATGGLWWGLADWSSSDWDTTVADESWATWFFDKCHDVATGGIELIEDIGKLASDAVVYAAQGVGLIPDESVIEESIRYIPDPYLDEGVRQVVDTERMTPLSRLGEQIITGVAAVDDALRAEGLRKSARIALMSLGVSVGVVVAAKSLVGVGKLAKWPFSKLWLWWHGPAAAAGVTTAKAMAVSEVLTVGQVGMLPVATQAGITLALAKGAVHAVFIAKLAKLVAASKIVVGAAIGVVGGIVFAKFFHEENDQQNKFIIREAVQRQERDWAISKLNRHIASLESGRNTAILPVVGPVIAADVYIESAIENAKKQREWYQADAEEWKTKRAKIEATLPVEVRELAEPGAATKQEKAAALEAVTRAEIIAIFMEVRRIRIFLGHKRVKAGEDISIDTANIPLIRTWVNRDRAALVKDRDAAQLVGRLELWLDDLKAAGFRVEVLRPSDREIALAKMGPYRKFKK